MTLALKIRDERSIIIVAGNCDARYGSPVAANSATGLGNPISKRRNSAPITIAGAFFVPAVTCYGGCAWEAFVPAGFLLPRFTNLRTAATHSLGNERGSSSAEGASLMKHALNPSKIRAHAHRRLAMATLRANSSLSVRLARYNHHAEIARALEAQGGAK
ncbi:UNVERIFIED_ORG: hypothetical protein J2W16_001504 [Pseudomonas cremoricolorata]|nr:hypothetical protein [Pseudomonas cremoricolorata]